MLLIVISVGLVCTVDTARSAQLSEERRLAEHLLADYGPSFVRPLHNSSHAVHVNFSISLNYIVDLDEHNQVLTTYLGKTHQWVDENLLWDPKDFGGLRRLVLPREKIWTPDIILITNMEEDNQSVTSSESVVAVESSGACTWSESAIYKSPCLVNMEDFPFDVQTCYLVFGAWMYTVEQVLLLPVNTSYMYGITTYNLVNNIEWTLVDYYLSIDVVKGNNTTMNREEEFRDFIITLVLERNSNYYAKFTLLPVLLLTGLVLLIFWIPPMRPDRTSLGMSLFASFLLLLILIVELSPPSAGVKLGAFCCIQMILISFATLLSVIVVNISHWTDPMPKWVNLVFLEYLEAMLHCRRVRASRCCKSSQENDYSPPDARNAQNSSYNAYWKRVAKVLDKLFFISYFFVLIGFFFKYFPMPKLNNFDSLTRQHYTD